MTQGETTAEHQDPGAARVREKQGKRKSTWREYAEALLVAALLAFVIRSFGVQAFKIPSGSMEDTLLVGDFLFVSKFLYGAEIPFTGGKRLPGFRDPQRGDIIVFRYPRDPSQDYIKRLVGEPGDTVEIRDREVFINGEPIEEPYVKHSPRRGSPEDRRENFGPFVVPEGEYFMLGDNRENSQDSRWWGTVTHEQLRGKAMFIYWSWDGDRGQPRWSRLGDIIH